MKEEIMEVYNQEKSKTNKTNRGFSLIELIVAIAIMAIMVIIISPKVMNYIGQSSSSVDEINITAYKTAVTTALVDEKVYAEVSKGNTVKIIVTGERMADLVYTNTSDTSELMKELDEILGSSYPLPKENEKNAFVINIDVNSIEKTVGELTVEPIKYTAP